MQLGGQDLPKYTLFDPIVNSALSRGFIQFRQTTFDLFVRLQGW